MRENLSFGFTTGSDTNRTVQPKTMARISVFRIKEVELLFYLFREYRRLCFCICKKNRVSHERLIHEDKRCRSSQISLHKLISLESISSII